MSDGPPGRISAQIHVSRGHPGPTGEAMRVQVCIPVTATPQWLVDHPEPDPGDAAAHRLWLTARWADQLGRRIGEARSGRGKNAADVLTAIRTNLERVSFLTPIWTSDGSYWGPVRVTLPDLNASRVRLGSVADGSRLVRRSGARPRPTAPVLNHRCHRTLCVVRRNATLGSEPLTWRTLDRDGSREKARGVIFSARSPP